MGVITDKSVTIHVGLHKTATTFLQERLFPALPGIRFVHPLHVPRDDDGPVEKFVLECFFRNGACIDMQRHERDITSWLETVDEGHVLISSEAIVGWPTENHGNLRVNADLLHEMFPTAKICLVTRRQDKWVDSAIAQAYRSGLATTPERYLNYRDGAFGRCNIGLYHGPNVDARDLSWDAFDRYYRRVFGADAVLTLPFERFVNDAAGFLAQFFTFFNIDPCELPETSEQINRRWSPRGVAVAKLVNHVPMPIQRFIRDKLGTRWHPSEVMARTVDRWVPSKKTTFIAPALAAEIMALHADTNRALAARTGEDLGAFGYY
jgi:hypothetical protein